MPHTYLDTEEANTYRLMKEAVDLLYDTYQYKGDAMSWNEFMDAEIALSSYAQANEDKIFTK